MLLGGPRGSGYPSEYWTLSRVAEVIEQLAGVRYHPGHVWRVLRKLGWSRQKPTTRARERDEVAAGQITGRGRTRIHRVARTLADLDTLDQITVDHVHAALALRANFRPGGSSRPDPTLEIAHHLTAEASGRGHTR